VESVRCTVEHGVALLWLDRPERNNAWTPVMRREFRATIAELESNAAVRAIVITGAGRAFCVGGDMEVLDRISGAGVMAAPENDDLSDELFGTDLGTFGFLLRTTKPVVAAINGATAGVGLILASFCDVRFAAAGSKFAVAMSRLGLPAEQGLSWILPRLIGVGHAADLLLAGRVILAEEAEGMGLVNRVFPRDDLLNAATEYAQNIAREISPASTRMMKQQLYADLVGDLPSSVEFANGLMEAALKSSDYREGVEAFRQRRPPQFM
jgi:enoyl-CoA hydratase/carnithine racemase